MRTAGDRQGDDTARALGVRFLVTREGRAPVRQLVSSVGDRLGARVDWRLYSRALGERRAPSQRRMARVIDAARGVARALRARRVLRGGSPEVIVFADLERLSWDERRRAAALHAKLVAARSVRRVLNHPTRSLCRYELLRALHVAGLNDFDVMRASESRRPSRYPVFLRDEDDHGGPVSGLIDTPAALEAALAERRRCGELAESTLIVEYCHTADAQGLVRKYGALRVGDRILPRHVFVGRSWVLKSTKDCDGVPREEMAQLELDYLARNPHADALMDRFERAGIEWGRADYAFKDGRLQIWEINTDPTVFLPTQLRDPVRGVVHEAFLRSLRDALRALV